MKKRLFILLILALVFISSSFVWFYEATQPVSRTRWETEEFVIERGEEIRQIANRLRKQGLIRSSLAFFLLTRTSSIASRIQAGHFRLSPSMSAREIAQILTHGTTDVWLITLEGWRSEEIALELARLLSIPEQEFLRFSQEGYMFPDTYLIPKEASAASIARIFRENFDRRVGSDIREAAKEQGLSLEEVVILSSIVEREAKLASDRPIVAAILRKRWQNNWLIQADATIQYALGYQPQEKRWWKRHLTKEDLEIDSPFNSYKNPGLPPTPIANPGLSSIRAVVFHQETDYWYYLSDSEGKMHYAETLDEHQENIRKYLR